MDDALHVGMEGEEATQEVIPRQVELRVLSKGPQQEEQGADLVGSAIPQNVHRVLNLMGYIMLIYYW